MAKKLLTDAFDVPDLAAAPANPAAGRVLVYSRAGSLRQKTSAGTESDLAAAGTGGTGAEKYRLTADAVASSSNTVFSNFTGLAFPIALGEQVEFEARIRSAAAIATTGLVLGVGGPTVTYLFAEAWTYTTAIATVRAHATAIDAAITLTGHITAAVDQYAYLTGTILASAAGTVQLKYRSEVSASAVTPKRGSWLQVIARG